VEWTDQQGQQSRGRSRSHRGVDTSGLHGHWTYSGRHD